MDNDQKAGQTPAAGKDPTPACVDFGEAIVLHQDPGATHELRWIGRGVLDGRVPQITLNAFPAAAVFRNKLYMAHQGTGPAATTVRYATYDDAAGLDASKWSAEATISGVSTSGAPALAVYKDKLYLAHSGAGIQENYLSYTVTDDGTTWKPDTLIPEVYLNGSPSMAVWGDRLYLFHQGASINSATGQLWYTTFDGDTWSKDVRVPNVSMVQSPSVVSYDGKLWVGYQHRQTVGKWTATMWYTAFDGEKWSDPSYMGSAAEVPIYPSSSPCLSADDNALWLDFYSEAGYQSEAVIQPGGGRTQASGAAARTRKGHG